MRVKASGRATSMPKGFLWGAITSITATMAMASILAWLIESNIIKHDYLGYGVMIILSTSAYFGAMVSHRKIKRQKLFVTFVSGGIYFIQLLILTALFFGGKYRAVYETALMIACGSFLYGILNFSNAGKRKKQWYS